MRMTNTQLKRIAQSALGSEYGFAPKVSDIILLESYTDGTYILFEVDGHQYRFESYVCRFGGVWVGPNTIKKLS